MNNRLDLVLLPLIAAHQSFRDHMSGSDHLSQHTHMSNFEQMSRNFIFNVLKYKKKILRVLSLKRSKEVKTGLALKTHKKNPYKSYSSYFHICTHDRTSFLFQITILRHTTEREMFFCVIVNVRVNF